MGKLHHISCLANRILRAKQLHLHYRYVAWYSKKKGWQTLGTWSWWSFQSFTNLLDQTATCLQSAMLAWILKRAGKRLCLHSELICSLATWLHCGKDRLQFAKCFLIKKAQQGISFRTSLLGFANGHHRHVSGLMTTHVTQCRKDVSQTNFPKSQGSRSCCGCCHHSLRCVKNYIRRRCGGGGERMNTKSSELNAPFLYPNVALSVWGHRTVQCSRNKHLRMLSVSAKFVGNKFTQEDVPRLVFEFAFIYFHVPSSFPKRYWLSRGKFPSKWTFKLQTGNKYDHYRPCKCYNNQPYSKATKKIIWKNVCPQFNVTCMH